MFVNSLCITGILVCSIGLGLGGPADDLSPPKPQPLRRSCGLGTEAPLRQDGGSGKKAKEGEEQAPEQVGLLEDSRFISQKVEPIFAIALPKKLAKTWAFVDLAKRRDWELEQLDEQIAAAKQDPAQAARVQQLEARRRQQLAFYSERARLRMEVRGDPKRVIVMEAARTSMDMQAPDFVKGLKENFGKWQGVEYHEEIDLTSKSEQKEGESTILLDFTATRPGGEGAEWFYMIVKRSNGSGKSLEPYRVLLYYQGPASTRNKKNIQELQKMLLQRLRFA